MPYSRLHNRIFCILATDSRNPALGGEHGESFDEATVLDKSKEGIVVVVFAGFASGKFRG
jgi:hypothetical protein